MEGNQVNSQLPSEKKSKRRRPAITFRAHDYATQRQKDSSATTWSEAERGTYWYGLYEGYIAGVRYARRQK